MACATSSALTRRPSGCRARSASAAAAGSVGLIEQPADPRRVGGAGQHRVDPDPLPHVVGCHRQRQGGHRSLAGGVEGALGQADRGSHRADVDDRAVGRAAQVREGGGRDPGDADHVDVEDVGPLGVVVLGHVPDRADAGVVDEHVEPAQVASGLGDGSVHGGPVGDVAREREDVAGAAHGPVDDGDPCAPLREQPGGGRTDAAGAAGHQGGQAVEVAHGCLLDRGSTWILGPGPAPGGRSPRSTLPTSSSDTVVATSGRGSTAPEA